MSYLSQIVHDARPRRAAAPLTAVGGARSSEPPLVDARLLPSPAIGKEPGAASRRAGAGPEKTLKPFREVSPQEEEALVQDPGPAPVPRPARTDQAAAVTADAEADAEDAFSEVVPVPHVSGPEQPRSGEAHRALAQTEGLAESRASSARRASRDGQNLPPSPDAPMIERERTGETTRPAARDRAQTLSDALLRVPQALSPVSAEDVGERPVEATDAHAPVTEAPAHLPTTAYVETRLSEQDPVPFDPAPGAPSTPATTEVRIGHLQIDIADAPQPQRAASPAPVRARPSPARFHVRRL